MGVPYVQFERVFYMPTGLVVGGTSLGQERECPRSLYWCEVIARCECDAGLYDRVMTVDPSSSLCLWCLPPLL
jgi:hypothetical protein